MEINPVDFFPRYDPYVSDRRRQQRYYLYTSILTHMCAMIAAVGICAAAFYYYDNFQKTCKLNVTPKPPVVRNTDTEQRRIEEIINNMSRIKGQIEETSIWRKHLDDLFSKIYLDQESIVGNKIEKAIDLYDSDKIGIFDYASVYAYGSIISTPDTTPYPANKSISFFNLVNYNILSDPELLLKPDNMPGNCFAFYGSKGRIRIKLGSPVVIKAVTLDHIKLLDDSMSSAPREFEVYGLHDPNDINGILLGSFIYDSRGRPYQTFKIEDSYRKYPFEYVELSILSNYGKQEFTCVYRFRVHNREPITESKR